MEIPAEGQIQIQAEKKAQISKKTEGANP